MISFRPFNLSLRRFWIVSLLATSGIHGSADVRLVREFAPGSPTEAAILFKNFGSLVADNDRRVTGGGGWIYRIATPPDSRIALSFESAQTPIVDVTGFDSKPVQSRHESGGHLHTIHCTAPATQPLGAAIRFSFHSAAPFSIREVRLTVRLPDTNGDGIADSVARMMGQSAKERATAIAAPSQPHTTFQTGSPYRPEIGLPTDAALYYGNNARAIRSWADAGIIVHAMGGFRDGAAYAAQHPDEVQRDVNGQAIEIGGNSFYLVPTQARIEIAKQYYRTALASGAVGVCPEEPEYWARGGYEEVFKREWLARYGVPWQSPHSSVDARYRAEQLKGQLETRLIDSVLSDARLLKPTATRMVALHSPVTYYQWGIPCPHNAMWKLPSVDEIIGQVWTGTARTPARSAGVRTERTFEVAYLEYSSLFQLTRGSGKRMWFLMDPVEDNPALQMEDYHKNYERTLLAALMFPEIDSYEVMPWPDRVYGRVPPDYATEVNTIVGALADLWQYADGRVEAGSPGIGTFVSDSMGWQRENPYPSDYDGFYGLCLPLVLHGVPVDILSLDRAAELHYLDREKVLLVSYDFLKPGDAGLNKALADWTRRGGSLIIVGGTDAYSEVTDSWWKKAGNSSPVEDLMGQLGLVTSRTKVVDASEPGRLQTPAAAYATLLKSEGITTGKNNRGQYVVDLTNYAATTGSVSLKFEDQTPQNGSGPRVYSIELRIGGKLAASFRAGSELETRFLEEDRDSHFDGSSRSVGGTGYWTYRFDNLPKDQQVTISLDMADGFLVKAASPIRGDPILRTADTSTERTLSSLRVRPGYPITLYSPPPEAKPLYALPGETVPAVWEATVGKGNVTFVGVAPGYMTATAQSSRWMRSLVSRSYQKAGGKYEEASSFQVHRGPYLGVRALGKEASLDGKYVDLLNSTLPILEDPVVPARSVGFFAQVGRPRGTPKLLAVSGRLRAKFEQPGLTSCMVQAPAGTNGTARIWCGKRAPAGIKAFTLYGETVPATIEEAKDSVLVRYPNHPDGVILRVGWK